MPIAFTFTLNPTPLSDNEVWFANAAAWNNYFKNVPASATMDAIITTVYAPTVYDATLVTYDFDIDGVPKYVPSKAQFDSLLASHSALDAAFQAMRTQLRNAGLITQAQ